MEEKTAAERILVIDDTEENVELISEMLAMKGYDVSYALSGKNGLDLAEKTSPDLILLDITMPEMNGFQVCEKLKESDKLKDIPVIFISALDETMDKVKAFEIGAVDYITKPFRLQEIIARVETHLKVRRFQRDLSHKNSELEQTLKDLTAARNKLIQSEKMASLGSLVAGVAHEVNTPLGIGVTASTHIKDLVIQVKEKVAAGTFGKTAFNQFLADMEEGADIIFLNLDRATELVKSFKKVSVDQSADTLREVNLKVYLKDILLSLKSKFKTTEINITIHCPEDAVVHISAGALSQIITNFLNNSYIHGFNFGKEPGEITITVTKQKEHYRIRYEDNGKGIDKDKIDKIFDPFFTTNRGKGGSGLGMNIVYNIISQKFGSEIQTGSTPHVSTWFEFDIKDQSAGGNDT